MKTKRSRWFKWQRGQAMMEYWPTIPAGVMIMIGAAALVQFILGGFFSAYEGLTFHGGMTCEYEEEVDEGPDHAVLDCHDIQLVGNVYDAENDRTTVSYRVTSGCDPSISHWALGMPAWMRDKILSVSELWEFGEDPNTGVYGLKFDKGYESDSDDGGPPPKKDKKSSLFGLSLVDVSRAPTAEERTVTFTLAGAYDFSVTTVAIKAGTEVYYSEISAPVDVSTPDETDEECDL